MFFAGLNVFIKVRTYLGMKNNMGVRRGQAALEYMMIIGMVLIILTPMIYYAYQQNETAIRSSQARLAASRIASAADSVYAQGPGARAYLDVLLPSGYSQQSFVSENVVNIRVSTPAGINDVIQIAKANMSGSLPAEPGYKRIYFTMLDSGQVNVTW